MPGTPILPSAAAPETSAERRRRRLAALRRHTSASASTTMLFTIAALAVLRFYHPPARLLPAPFERVARAAAPMAEPSPNAFGRSGEVKVRFALPSEPVEYPLEVAGDPSTLAYQWVRVGQTASATSLRPLTGAAVVAPPSPGFYNLAVVRQSIGVAPAARSVVQGMTLAVLVPFEAKSGNLLNGYRIGTYIAERTKREHDRPDGFLEVGADMVDLRLSKHLRLGDFVTHDNQDVWPRYAALNPRLLDKLELVIARIGSWRGDTANVNVGVDVHSGFRTPLYNRTVKRSARDSRHQYGDAADVTIDANGDGRYTLADTKLVVRAVEEIEQEHPDLVGGVGLYTSRRYSTPYVHIDARGTRARWHG
ncbi:MAG TPA: D-Ala-D-Ala carboxypeptidase family metallohydrolase [Gemmatimonadaceae bacterium]|nr:D-Ala-D-Ala carboxypeptidase family metallohydrolase [Gemmatimonadaceae bacterium]